MPTLKARIGGAWVAVGGGSGGGSEVEISATDPIGTNPSAELWYDTAAGATGVTVASPGLVAYAQAPSADQSVGSNVTVDITGVSVTFNAIAGHTYKTTLFACVQSGASGAGVYHVNICDAANTVKHSAMIGMPISDTRAASQSLVESNLSGSTTRKGQFAMLFGGGSASAIIVNTSARNAYIIVEDITPATADGLATAWTAASFVNNWTNAFGPTYQGVQYRRVGDIVYIRGLCLRTAVPGPNDETIFTLPVGYRPPAQLVWHGWGSTTSATQASCRGDISAAGAVGIQFGPTVAGNWLTFGALSFSVTA